VDPSVDSYIASRMRAEGISQEEAEARTEIDLLQPFIGQAAAVADVRGRRA
jgi:hypothetical protein